MHRYNLTARGQIEGDPQRSACPFELLSHQVIRDASKMDWFATHASMAYTTCAVFLSIMTRR